MKDLRCEAALWWTEDRLARMERCRQFLFGEGVLMDAESNKVGARILKAKREKERHDPPKPKTDMAKAVAA